MDHERNLSLSDVFPFWWYATWRLFVVMFLVSVAVVIVQTLAPLSLFVSNLLDWGIVLLGMVVQIFFLRNSLNRTYKPYGQAAYRVTVQSTEATHVAVTTNT